MWDRYDPRGDERDRDSSWQRNFGSRGSTNERERDYEHDPRDVFTKDLDLPRGRDRRPARDRDRVYEINGTEGRMLATVGAFRVVSESDLHDGREDTRKDLRHLEREGLADTYPLSSDDRAVVLTGRGRDLLEANRHERQDRTWKPRQTFYAGLRKPRELTHDSKVYRAYVRAEDHRGKKDCDGRPDRQPDEIARWAREYELPYDDGHVRFPDVRIEYEDRDGRSRHEDLEVVTGHYRGAHAGAAAKSGFTCYLSTGCSVGGRGGGGRRTVRATEHARPHSSTQSARRIRSGHPLLSRGAVGASRRANCDSDATRADARSSADPLP